MPISNALVAARAVLVAAIFTPVCGSPNLVMAGAPAPKFELTVNNQTGEEIKVEAFNNDDTMKMFAATEKTLTSGTSGAVSCNTNSSCYVRVSTRQAASGTATQAQSAGQFNFITEFQADGNKFRKVSWTCMKLEKNLLYKAFGMETNSKISRC